MSTIYEVKFKVPSLNKTVTLKSTKKVFDLNKPDEIEMFYVNENVKESSNPIKSLKPEILKSLKEEISEIKNLLEGIKTDFPDLKNDIDNLPEPNPFSSFFKTETNPIASVFK